MDRPLDHPAVEAKSEADLILGASITNERIDLRLPSPMLDGDRTDGPCLHQDRRPFLVAARKRHGDQCGYCDNET